MSIRSFRKTINRTSMNPYASFIVQKNPYSRSRVARMRSFSSQNGPIVLNENFFFGKTINITFIYLSATFIMQNFKKLLKTDPEL